VRAEAARTVRGSRGFRLAARAGFAVNGLLHVLMGLLATGIAVGAGRGTSADPGGALGAVAATPGGGALLWVLAAGLAALALWLLVEGLLVEAPAGRRREAVVDVLKAFTYGALAATAVAIALGGRADSDGEAREASAALLAAPGGVLLLGAIGVGVAVLGVVVAAKGVRRGFLDDLRLPRGALGRTVTALGVTGYVAKGVALVAVGGIVVTAAVTTDASEAGSFDDALRTIAELPFGVVLLTLVGIGLVAYGAYCAARARWARL